MAHRDEASGPQRWVETDRRLTALEARTHHPAEATAGRPAHTRTEPIERLEQRHHAPVPAPARPPVMPLITPEGAGTVHVTIGRVEVRAIVPPAPASRRPPRSPGGPSLSLDDYLKNRSAR